jgi:DNA polymerase-3 subunit epsilon
MRAMTKDYHKLSDGYPDIMVIENQQLRFEEVKAPGDQLRKNQLLTIRHLRDLGFDVRISKVDWFIDPQQAYVVVDIETTGGKSDQHRITEIGMVKMINGERVDYWQSLINPQRHIPRFITQLTGIDDEMVVNAPLFCEVSDNLLRFLEGSVFVAHNVGFDYGFFKREFERIGHNFRMPKLCTVREMRKAKPGLKSYSLANLTDHFDIAMTQHHRALSDAEAAAELLMIINEHRMSYTQKDDNPTKVG